MWGEGGPNPSLPIRSQTPLFFDLQAQFGGEYLLENKFLLRGLEPLLIQKNHSESTLSGFDTPKATLVEQPQTDVEQFLAMLRFENRSKVEELTSV